MDPTVNYKYKIDFLISNDTSLIQTTQTIVKKRKKKVHCSECYENWVLTFSKSHQPCNVCYRYKAKRLTLSGNKVIDDFIKHMQINYSKTGVKMEFVPHDQFKNIEFIAEGGFSKI